MGELENQRCRKAIVLVDDDPAVLGSLQFSLELEGYDVRAYLSADELIKAEGPDRPACFVIDYNLPGMNGLDLVDLLRGQGIRQPIILITTMPNPTLRMRAAEAGVTIVEKPLLGTSIIKAIAALLGPVAGPSTTLEPARSD